jgi:RNA polymerase sigma-70 factor, ECF subfamily
VPATTLQVNPEPIAVNCYQEKVQELTNVIARHSSRFRQIAMRRLSNVADAEDAVQDALLSALKHLDQFREQAKMSTWLTTIVINSARMELRRRLPSVQLASDENDGQRNLALEEVVTDPRPSPEEAYCKREIAGTLALAVSRLSPTLHTTFRLRDVAGLSIRETADLLGVPTGTVKARLARARMRLRKVMRENVQPRRGGDL